MQLDCGASVRGCITLDGASMALLGVLRVSWVLGVNLSNSCSRAGELVACAVLGVCCCDMCGADVQTVATSTQRYCSYSNAVQPSRFAAARKQHEAQVGCVDSWRHTCHDGGACFVVAAAAPRACSCVCRLCCCVLLYHIVQAV
jgi:hypothetical protein